ncbi:ARM repeat-containing protein [Panus rudis PR-1116 ss-1]|nr:ARM repeat-containing protein [Panus rudis PR-1116 ss-1]
MPAETRTGGQGSPKKLRFHEKLTGKGLSTDALQKKLKALFSELQGIQQTHVDTHSLGTVRKELISNSILLHKDRGVKAYAACCLVDLLRLYAPDAPFTQAELRDMFSFFFRQLTTGLKGPDSPYYNEYFHILESLAEVKSVVLVCDLPNADELLAEIFRGLFTLVRHDLAKNIEQYMAEILIALIDECQSLPSEVLECIMAQFMDKNARMDQPAYRLAVTVCNATADKLQRNVCQYFTDIIVTHSTNEDYEEIQNAHELIKRLNRACPALLHNVVPQLEEELRVEDTQIRVLATQVLGEMFADKSGADFRSKYPSTWNLWLHRKNDKSISVRLAFVEATKGVLVHHPDLREPIEEALQIKLLDPDDKVRAAVCQLYSHLDFETALHHVSEKQLRAVAGRGLDRKRSVHVASMTAIARLYSLAYPEIESGEPAATRQFGWIPQMLLNFASVNADVKGVVEQVVDEFILPLPQLNSADEVAWTDRLLFIMKFLDESSTNILLTLSHIKAGRPSIYERFLECCIKNNGGVIDENEESIVQELNFTVKKLAATFPDPHKATEDLKAFAKSNENRLYKLLKICMDPQTDLKTLIKTTHEFIRRIEQTHAPLLQTFSTFLRRCSLRIVNQSSIPTLIKRLQKGSSGGAGESQNGAAVTNHAAHNAQTWLTFISKHYPALYKLHVGELAKGVADEKNSRLVEIALQAMAAVSSWDPKLAPADKKTIERLARYAQESDYRHAKFAVRVLTYTKNSQELCTEIVDIIADSLPEADPDTRVAHIAVLAELASKAPEAFEQKSDVIMGFLVKKVLMTPIAPNPDEMETEEDEWVEDSDLSAEQRAKILALKTCRRRCLSHASEENALELAKPVLTMFTTLVHTSGSLSEKAADDPRTRARLRCQAAISLLHLATVHQYAQVINTHFVELAIMIQDPCYQIRLKFIHKLLGLLGAQKLPTNYHIIPFVTVHDPEADIKNRATAYIQLMIRSMPKAVRLTHFEMNIIRFLHLLAHHPDFNMTQEGLVDISKYVDFFLDHVATADNISLLYHLAVRLKTVRDAESHAYSENLYAASELAQHLIKQRATAHHWALESYPGKVKMPGDILRPLPSPEAASQVLKTVYLPEEMLTYLAEKAKSGKHASEAKVCEMKSQFGVTQHSLLTGEGEGRAESARQTEGSSKDQRQHEVGSLKSSSCIPPDTVYFSADVRGKRSVKETTQRKSRRLPKVMRTLVVMRTLECRLRPSILHPQTWKTTPLNPKRKRSD